MNKLKYFSKVKIISISLPSDLVYYIDLYRGNRNRSEFIFEILNNYVGRIRLKLEREKNEKH